MKQRNASSGVQTIGSPRTLKLVLTSTGQPVSALKRAEQLVEQRVGFAMHGLDARRIVDMRHRRNLRARDIELVDAEQRLFLCASSVRRLSSLTSATISM